MKLRRKSISRTIFLILVFFLVFWSVQNASASTISGYVYDNHNNALIDVDVELLNENYQLRSRSRSDGSGRYTFDGLGDGRFYVKAMPFRYDYQDQQQEVYINSISAVGGGASVGFYTQDFYLVPRKGSLEEVEASVIFAQDIPKDAKKLYEKAVQDFSKKRPEEGANELKESIKIFPDYFLALNRLGKEYFLKGLYSEAYQMLIKAANVNPKSPTTLFFLGYSLHKLNYNKAALVALNQAHNLSPASVALLWTLGVVERAEGKFTEAEKHLLQAKKLAKTPVADIHWELAQLYGENLKKYESAADELESFLKARPDAQDAAKIKDMIKKLKEKAKTEASK
jgi:tetratricopeptide (TPR) repeat protein